MAGSSYAFLESAPERFLKMGWLTLRASVTSRTMKSPAMLDGR